MRTTERGVLVGIVVAVAAVLRVGFVVAGRVRDPLRADAGEYAQYAKNLCEHATYSMSTAVPPAPDSFRSPGYPAFLALCRWLGGDGAWQSLAIGVQVALGTVTVLLAYRVARSVLDFWPALAAATLCALSPHLVVVSAYVLTECVTMFAVAAALWLAFGAVSRTRLAAAAVACGFCVLCNEALLFMPLAIAWPLLRTGRGRALVFTLVAFAPFAAWNVRNAVQPLERTGSARATASISHGSYPGMVFRDPSRYPYPYYEDPEQPAFGASWSALGEVLGRRVAADPWRYAVWYACEKPVWLWGWHFVQGKDVLVYGVDNSPYDAQAVMRATHTLMRWLHVPVMLLAAIGAIGGAFLHRRLGNCQLQALGLVAILGTLAYVPVIPDPRYMQPLRPVLFVLAAAGGAAIVARWRARTAQPPAA